MIAAEQLRFENGEKSNPKLMKSSMPEAGARTLRDSVALPGPHCGKQK